jgi:RecJ-like exonuclease
MDWRSCRNWTDPFPKAPGGKTMLCPICYGKGTLERAGPCPECGGLGLVHCCEGDAEQAEPEEEDGQK